MAFKTGNQTLPGYPRQVGDKIEQTFDHTGPASYTQFASPTTGGDIINAADIGVGGFDSMQPVVDTTGQIIAYPVLTLAGYGNAVPKVYIAYWSLVTGTVGGQAQTLGTQVVATTDLHTFSFRFKATCV
jgi:hypothetical protein